MLTEMKEYIELVASTSGIAVVLDTIFVGDRLREHLSSGYKSSQDRKTIFTIFLDIISMVNSSVFRKSLHFSLSLKYAISISLISFTFFYVTYIIVKNYGSNTNIGEIFSRDQALYMIVIIILNISVDFLSFGQTQLFFDISSSRRSVGTFFLLMFSDLLLTVTLFSFLTAFWFAAIQIAYLYETKVFDYQIYEASDLRLLKTSKLYHYDNTDPSIVTFLSDRNDYVINRKFYSDNDSGTRLTLSIYTDNPIISFKDVIDITSSRGFFDTNFSINYTRPMRFSPYYDNFSSQNFLIQGGAILFSDDKNHNTYDRSFWDQKYHDMTTLESKFLSVETSNSLSYSPIDGYFYTSSNTEGNDYLDTTDKVRGSSFLSAIIKGGLFGFASGFPNPADSYTYINGSISTSSRISTVFGLGLFKFIPERVALFQAHFPKSLFDGETTFSLRDVVTSLLASRASESPLEKLYACHNGKQWETSFSQSHLRGKYCVSKVVIEDYSDYGISSTILSSGSPLITPIGILLMTSFGMTSLIYLLIIGSCVVVFSFEVTSRRIPVLNEIISRSPITIATLLSVNFVYMAAILYECFV